MVGGGGGEAESADGHLAEAVVAAGSVGRTHPQSRAVLCILYSYHTILSYYLLFFSSEHQQ
jgi:hypothetical protein